MKKRILSLLLVSTILTSVCAFAPLNAGAENAETYAPPVAIDWNGHTYHVYDVSMTWEEAKQYCENLGGYLATITSEQENNTISDLISYYRNKSMYWLGGYNDGDWKWITGESFDYTNWNYGEPTNTQKCLAMYSEKATREVHDQAKHGKWLDNPNNGIGSWSVSETGFICEFDGTKQQARFAERTQGLSARYDPLLPHTLYFENMNDSYVYRISIWDYNGCIIKDDIVSGNSYTIPANTAVLGGMINLVYVKLTTYTDYSLDSAIVPGDFRMIATLPTFFWEGLYEGQEIINAKELKLKFYAWNPRSKQRSFTLDDLDFRIEIRDAGTGERADRSSGKLVHNEIIYDSEMDLSKYAFLPGHIYNFDVYAILKGKELEGSDHRQVKISKKFAGGNVPFSLEQPPEKPPIIVKFNDKKIEFDVQPFIEDNRTLVPVRSIFEAMGMTVEWDGATSTITASGQGNTISMRINDTMAIVNGKTMMMDVPPRVIDERTLVPVRFIAESLDAHVNWNAEKREVIIYNRVYFFNKFNQGYIQVLFSKEYTFDKWYDYYLDSIHNNKAKWASRSIIKFWSNPFTYWSETDTKKIMTAVLMDALTSDVAVESIEEKAKAAVIVNFSEDVDTLVEYLFDKASTQVGTELEKTKADIQKLQEAKKYINSHKDLSNLTPQQLDNHNQHIIDYNSIVEDELKTEKYKQLKFEKLDRALKSAGIVCDVMSVVNAGTSKFNTIMALVQSKEAYEDGLDLIAQELSGDVSEAGIAIRESILEIKKTMNQSMAESISQCALSSGKEFMNTSIAETIAKEFVVRSLKAGAEKFLIKIGVDASKAAGAVSKIGQGASLVGTAITAGQIATAACNFVLGTTDYADATYQLAMLMYAENAISLIFNNYYLPLVSGNNTISEVTDIANVLKAIMMHASLLTNKIYNVEDNSLIDQGFRLVFSDEEVFNNRYNDMYQNEISRIKGINFGNY